MWANVQLSKTCEKKTGPCLVDLQKLASIPGKSIAEPLVCLRRTLLVASSLLGTGFVPGSVQSLSTCCKRYVARTLVHYESTKTREGRIVCISLITLIRWHRRALAAAENSLWIVFAKQSGQRNGYPMTWLRQPTGGDGA